MDYYKNSWELKTVACFSSSLDDLEIDCRSGGVSDRSPIHYSSLGSSEAMACSRDGLDLPTSLQSKVFDAIFVYIVFLLSKSLRTRKKHLYLMGENEFPVGSARPSTQQFWSQSSSIVARLGSSHVKGSAEIFFSFEKT